MHRGSMVPGTLRLSAHSLAIQQSGQRQARAIIAPVQTWQCQRHRAVLWRSPFWRLDRWVFSFVFTGGPILHLAAYRPVPCSCAPLVTSISSCRMTHASLHLPRVLTPCIATPACPKSSGRAPFLPPAHCRPFSSLPPTCLGYTSAYRPLAPTRPPCAAEP